MALPPTGLTELLYGRAGSADSVMGVLDRFGCFSKQALALLPDVKAYIENAMAEYASRVREDGAVGPSLPDALVRALQASPFLSEHRVALSRTHGTVAAEGMNYWRVACLSFAIPSEYRFSGIGSRDQITLPGPPGYFGMERSAKWWGEGEREIAFVYWQPRAPYPGGPMKASSSWHERIGDAEVPVTETSMFFGVSKRVLVTHLNFSSPIAQGMLVAEGLSRMEFSAVLRGIELRDAQLE